MKKWIIGILVVLLVFIIWRGVNIYQSALEPLDNAEAIGNEIALEKTPIETIEDSYTYFGTKAYQVVIGKNDEGDKMIAWVPQKKGEIVTRFERDGITEKDALAIIKSERDPQEIRSVKLGLEDNIPIWEIIYIGRDNRLTYHKLYFENGKYRDSIKP
ncbi:cell wall elongation regulator TseB-like domain-containing protein [Bacillus sp. JJ1562]|uniref:cell wall elongation regulator TseB-like domain-containing protein n=1 Tax=Bacillus sp. JJ1562 TaxID=3122960 RepID=UPI00300255EF